MYNIQRQRNDRSKKCIANLPRWGTPHSGKSSATLHIILEGSTCKGLRHGSQQRELGFGESACRQMHGVSISYLLTEASVSPHRQDDAVMSGTD